MAELKKNSRPGGDASDLAEKNLKIDLLPISSDEVAEKKEKGSKKKKKNKL